MISGLGSKNTAHDDTREFIRGLEMTARKVRYPLVVGIRFTSGCHLSFRSSHLT